MHINWYSIKQRPHFLAEHLSEQFDMHIFHYSSIIERYRVKNRNKGLKDKNRLNLKRVIRIPYSTRQKALYKIESVVNRVLFSKTFKAQDYDIIWISNPRFLEFIDIETIKLDGKLVVYDCMDDILEFSNIRNNGYMRRRHEYLEQRLLLWADIVFASSEELKRRLINRQKLAEAKIQIINNALDSSMFDFDENDSGISRRSEKKYIVLLYFGSIADWFDMETLLEVINSCESVRIILLGPAAIDIPRHERIIYKRPVSHGELCNYAKNADCLIMPFKLNRLVTAVDPVKIYEYIGFHKIIISIRYDELKKFDRYIYFYDNFGELINLINRIGSGDIKPKYGAEEAKTFIEQNNWSSRVKKILEIINENLRTNR